MVDVPEEVGDGAIRMVAFGVLEHKPAMLSTGLFQQEANAIMAAQEIEQLVMREVIARGWKLSLIAFRNGREFILLGRQSGSAALPTRPKIGQGTLQEVCRAAVDWLDNGPQPSPLPPGDRYPKR